MGGHSRWGACGFDTVGNVIVAAWEDIPGGVLAALHCGQCHCGAAWEDIPDEVNGRHALEICTEATDAGLLIPDVFFAAAWEDMSGKIIYFERVLSLMNEGHALGRCIAF